MDDSVESDLLGFIERTRSSSISKDEIKTVAKSQSSEIIEIEKYYIRAGERRPGSSTSGG